MNGAYPEHEKLDAVKDKSQAIGEFIEWLETEKHVRFKVGYSPETDEVGEPVYRDFHGELVQGWKPPSSFPASEHHTNNYKEAVRRQREDEISQLPAPAPCGEMELTLRQKPQQLLAEFFEIDSAKLEAERRQMLASLRKARDDSG